MKWFLIFLAIGLAASEKLDRTYLPPPGAQFSGGNLGDGDVPLEPPGHSHSVLAAPEHGGSQTNFGLSEEPVNFGDKIAKVPFRYYSEKVPTTTTSYAFSQTTTYPPAENYETTVLPINPVTGLPVNLEHTNYPYSSIREQQDAQNLPTYAQNQVQSAPSYGTNIQPGFGTSAPATLRSPSYEQFENQPLSQNKGFVELPGSVYQTNHNQGPIRYPGDQGNKEQNGFLATAAPGSQGFENYPGQNVVNPGGTIQIPRGSPNLIQYPIEQLTGQHLVPSTASPTNILPSDNQYEANYDASQLQIPQGIYSNQPKPQLNEAFYQNQQPQNIGPGSGSTSSTIPSSYYNDISGTTPLPGISSPTSTYSSVPPVNRPERPQAAGDTKAIIINYENVRTPNSYSYSFDTSNGIHADESGIIDNGTKAQGAYSYIGDDGKVYSVIYTADENGFQPRGDHLPTPPPIPEAIKRVIEQAARDKDAGIIDDGSYDEAKYGDKKYQSAANRRLPQKLNSNRVENKPFIAAKNDQIKPIAGINDSEYDEGKLQDQFTNVRPITDTRKQNGKIHSIHIFEGKTKLNGDDAPSRNLDQNGIPIVTEGINELDIYGTKKSGFSDGPLSESNLPYNGAKDANQNYQYGVKDRRPSVSGLVKDMKTKYPGSEKEVNADYPESERDEYYDRERQDIVSGSPSVSEGLQENINTKYDSATGAPIKRIKGNRQPSTKTSYNQNGKTQDNYFSKETTNTPSISDYIKNAVNQPKSTEKATQQDESGYNYQPPNNKFEQTKFPTRFSTPEPSSDQRRTEINRGTTRRPFITPNVYSQNDKTRTSTTRRPFTTIGVTSPMDNSYTDYDDSDNYGTDQNTDGEGNNSPKNPNKKSGSTYRPYQGTYKTGVPQKDSANLGDRIKNSGTVAPGYRFGTTTPIASQSSRFGSTEKPQAMSIQQGMPSATIPDSSTAVGRPVTSQIPSRTSDYKYTEGPVSEYHATSVVPVYPATGVIPGFNLVSSTPGVSVPQSSTTSTYGPSKDYSSTAAVPPSSGYNPHYDYQKPSSTTGNYHTGYHYGPPKSNFSFNVLPNAGRANLGFFTPSGTPGISPIYQTYQQGPDGFLSTTSVPTIPGRSDSFIQSPSGSIAPESSPIGTYTGKFLKGPSTPNYSTTIVASTPETRPVFGYTGSSRSPIPQDTHNYEYGSSSPAYSTTVSPSTLRTTPGLFIPSSGPTQGFSTTYRPGFQTNEDTFISGSLVDGFGRPITVEQGDSHLVTTGPKDNEGPKLNTEQATANPYDQSKVIGEDFSGPKQPQRYDPKTGYHYK